MLVGKEECFVLCFNFFSPALLVDSGATDSAILTVEEPVVHTRRGTPHHDMNPSFRSRPHN